MGPTNGFTIEIKLTGARTVRCPSCGHPLTPRTTTFRFGLAVCTFAPCMKFAKDARIAKRSYDQDTIDLFRDVHGLRFFAPKRTDPERFAFQHFAHVDETIERPMDLLARGTPTEIQF